MNELLKEIAGWYGFLQRLPVLAQILGLVVILLACHWAGTAWSWRAGF